MFITYFCYESISDNGEHYIFPKARGWHMLNERCLPNEDWTGTPSELFRWSSLGTPSRGCWLSMSAVNMCPRSSVSGLSGGPPPVLKRSLRATAFVCINCIFVFFQMILKWWQFWNYISTYYTVCYISGSQIYLGPTLLCYAKQTSQGDWFVKE